MSDDHIMYIIGPIQIFLYIMWVACRIFYTFATHMTCAYIGLQIYELCRPTPISPWPCLIGHTAGCSSRGDQDGDPDHGR